MVDFLFHRLEKARYEFIKRVLPHVHELMFLESYDEISLEAWNSFLSSQQHEWPKDSVDEIESEGRLDYYNLASILRNATMHAYPIVFAMIRDATGWAAWMKDVACLEDMEGILKALYCYISTTEGNENPGREARTTSKQHLSKR